MGGDGDCELAVLGRLSIQVKFKEPGKIRGRGGEAVYGFLLNEISKVSEKYAEFFHDTNGIKPFSISPLMKLKNSDGAISISEGILTIPKETTAMIVISALEEKTIGVIMKALIDAYKQKHDINIGGIRAEIEKVCIRESEGAKYLSYSDILKKRRRKKSAVFKLLTPLSFRHNGVQMTFPTPELVFGSLLRTWNTFSDVKISEELREKFPQIAVSRYELRTEMWHFSRYKIFGCRGRITYDFNKGFSGEEIKLLNALCELANFSGIGYKRTMGMGMVEVRFNKQKL